MRRKGQGIRFQLTAGIVLMTMAGIGLIGLMSVKIVERSALVWKISQAEEIAGFLRAATSLSPEGGEPLAARFAAVLTDEARISDFSLTSSGGRLIASSGSMPEGAGKLVYSGAVEAYMYGGGLFSGVGEFMRVSAAVPSGRFEFILPLVEVKEDMARAAKFLLLYALIDSAVIIAFGVWFVSRSIVQPLRKLEEAAKTIAGGKLFDRAEVDVDNEVGSLAASFNSMAERLEGEIKSLERVNLELTTAQDELLRNSTLAAVGRLAAGIAHEIGNPLGALKGYIDILSRGGLEPAEEKEIIARAAGESDRIDSIVRDFLEVARPARRPSFPVDVNSLVRETLEGLFVRADFQGVETGLVLSEVPAVMADDGKLRQVFSNLLINAAQAMEGMEKKTITVTTASEDRPIPVKAGRRKGDAPVESKLGRFVLVSVKDTGAGVSSVDAARVFDPFFTTKEVGKGTGLGLFVSRSIIKAYGGEITLMSGGAGSEFTVALPAAEAPQ